MGEKVEVAVDCLFVKEGCQIGDGKKRVMEKKMRSQRRGKQPKRGRRKKGRHVHAYVMVTGKELVEDTNYSSKGRSRLDTMDNNGKVLMLRFI